MSKEQDKGENGYAFAAGSENQVKPNYLGYEDQPSGCHVKAKVSSLEMDLKQLALTHLNMSASYFLTTLIQHNLVHALLPSHMIVNYHHDFQGMTEVCGISSAYMALFFSHRTIQKDPSLPILPKLPHIISKSVVIGVTMPIVGPFLLCKYMARYVDIDSLLAKLFKDDMRY